MNKNYRTYISYIHLKSGKTIKFESDYMTFCLYVDHDTRKAVVTELEVHDDGTIEESPALYIIEFELDGSTFSIPTDNIEYINTTSVVIGRRETGNIRFYHEGKK